MSTSSNPSLVAIRQSSEISQDSSQPATQQWYVNDTLDMRRFKEMIPNPAITYPFELDDF